MRVDTRVLMSSPHYAPPGRSYTTHVMKDIIIMLMESSKGWFGAQVAMVTARLVRVGRCWESFISDFIAGAQASHAETGRRHADESREPCVRPITLLVP